MSASDKLKNMWQIIFKLSLMHLTCQRIHLTSIYLKGSRYVACTWHQLDFLGSKSRCIIFPMHCVNHQMCKSRNDHKILSKYPFWYTSMSNSWLVKLHRYKQRALYITFTWGICMVFVRLFTSSLLITLMFCCLYHKNNLGSNCPASQSLRWFCKPECCSSCLNILMQILKATTWCKAGKMENIQ